MFGFIAYYMKRSKLTAMMCHKAGFKTIYDLDKGLEGRMKAGKPKV